MKFFYIKSILIKHQVLLFNIAFLLSLLGLFMFLIHGYDAFKNNKKEPMLLSLAILALIADIIRMPYKWDKYSIRIQSLLKLPIFFTTVFFYSIPFFNI